jgi:hypothetical protein
MRINVVALINSNEDEIVFQFLVINNKATKVTTDPNDRDRIVATFASDAYVNDNRREIWGTKAISAFIAKESWQLRTVFQYGSATLRADSATAP